MVECEGYGRSRGGRAVERAYWIVWHDRCVEKLKRSLGKKLYFLSGLEYYCIRLLLGIGNDFS